MAIIAQGFETLITNKGTEKCDFGELLERSRQIKEQWQNSIVINENGTNFNLDKDLKFHYMTDYGKKKEADISEFAFSQLCSRMGVPAIRNLHRTSPLKPVWIWNIGQESFLQKQHKG